jgi:hypothetical protein
MKGTFVAHALLLLSGCAASLEFPPRAPAIPAGDTVTINPNGSETIAPPVAPECAVRVRNLSVPLDCARAGAIRQ